MTNNNGKRHGRPVGVWNRGSKRGPVNPIRVRTKRLDEVQGDKIALAYWLLAKQIVRDESDASVSEEEARRLAEQLDERSRTEGPKQVDRRREAGDQP